MDSWASVLDLDWHEEDSQNCSIEVLDGDSGLFDAAPRLIVARSQLPNRLDFQGWIAFNPTQKLDETALFWTSVHEIGHILGLPHSVNANSVMYGLSLEGLVWLDPTDLAELATHHKLRTSQIDKPFPLIRGAGTCAGHVSTPVRIAEPAPLPMQ